jgi:hypothetical protein
MLVSGRRAPGLQDVNQTLASRSGFNPAWMNEKKVNSGGKREDECNILDSVHPIHK